MDTSFLLRIGNKIPMKGVTETKFGAKTKGWTIQRLPHLGIHPIISHQTHTLLHNAIKILLMGPCYSCIIWGYASAWQIEKCMLTDIYKLEHRSPNREARESTQGAEGVCNLIGGTIWTNQYPQSLFSSCICSRRWPSWPSMGREAPWPCKFYISQYRGTQGQEAGVGE